MTWITSKLVFLSVFVSSVLALWVSELRRQKAQETAERAKAELKYTGDMLDAQRAARREGDSIIKLAKRRAALAARTGVRLPID